MPELAELSLMRDFVNRHSAGHVYHRVTKSDCITGKIGRSPLVDVPRQWGGKFKMNAISRGKEMKVVFIDSKLDVKNVVKMIDEQQRLKDSGDIVKLNEMNNGKNVNDNIVNDNIATSSTDIVGIDPVGYFSVLFRAGMTGYWEIAKSVDGLHKHAHLHMHRDDGNIVAFVDQRRFGSWHLNEDWGSDRSPCPVQEYEMFRAHVLANLHKSAFDGWLCEVLLDQRYFNGIGNYLRAEICYRAGVNPFMRARDAFTPLLNDEQREALNTMMNKPAVIKRTASVGVVDDEIDETAESDENTQIVLNDDAVVTDQHSGWGDVLQLCRQLPVEVKELRFKYNGMTDSAFADSDEVARHETMLQQAFAGNKKIASDTDLSKLGFSDWLRCYDQDDMMKATDKKQRTIYFDKQWRRKQYKSGSGVKRKPNSGTKQQKETRVTPSNRVGKLTSRLLSGGDDQEAHSVHVTAVSNVAANADNVTTPVKHSKRTRTTVSTSVETEMTTPVSKITKSRAADVITRRQTRQSARH